MQSVMGGVYPGPGITLGPGLAFGYLAARHAAARAKQPASAALTLPLECDTHVPAR